MRAGERVFDAVAKEESRWETGERIAEVRCTTFGDRFGGGRVWVDGYFGRGLWSAGSVRLGGRSVVRLRRFAEHEQQCGTRQRVHAEARCGNATERLREVQCGGQRHAGCADGEGNCA